MVGMRRLAGPKNPAELTYYVQLIGAPLLGTTAAKILNTLDSQTMALTLGYFVQLQAECKYSASMCIDIAPTLRCLGIVNNTVVSVLK